LATIDFELAPICDLPGRVGQPSLSTQKNTVFNTNMETHAARERFVKRSASEMLLLLLKSEVGAVAGKGIGRGTNGGAGARALSGRDI
jgi:hypothetical protein